MIAVIVSIWHDVSNAPLIYIPNDRIILKFLYSEYQGDAGTGCASKWTCCGLRSTIQECEAPQNKRWTCCNQGWVSDECTDITKAEQLYLCCKQESGAKGCHMIYKCCGSSGKGCHHYYPCCNEEGPNEGGCIRKCVNCRKDWGTGPGCVEAV